MEAVALALWAAVLIAAWFYADRARHPEQRPLAAWLIFVIVFTVASFGIFAALTLLFQVSGQAALLSEPPVIVLFLIAVFAPAFLIGRWQLRKPPRQRPVP